VEPVGTHEAAAIAGISRQRFSLLAQQGRVPAPIAYLRCGTIWDKADIEAWVAARNANPGRPFAYDRPPPVPDR
jgi:predicted DNA-binding transcriptional regulator AlpA